METIIEYRVRPVTRYVVTRFSSRLDRHSGQGTSAGCELCGEFDNARQAEKIATALASTEEKSEQTTITVTA